MGLAHVRETESTEVDHGHPARVRNEVEACLEAFFAAKRAQMSGIAVEGVALVDAVAELTLRGGKRVRPALLAAAYAAVATGSPHRAPADVLNAGASLELLQTYLLIHDDWMDGDAVRRGGKAVHTAFSEVHGAPTGAALAILAGNLASTYAWELLLASAEGPARDQAVEVFHRMHREVVVGQQLDLIGSKNVSLMHRLKTGSYTVRGPLDLGAVLGGASDEQRQALHAFGTPLGEAFQLRDDLLGVFGDPAKTGKPASDLRSGRHTSVLAAAGDLPVAERRVLLAARAREAGPDALAAARAVLERSGARHTVEAHLDALLEQAMSALDGAPLSRVGIEQLTRLASKLARRTD